MTPQRFAALAAPLVLVLGSIATPAAAQRLVVTPDHANGTYDVGETITWKIAYDASGGPRGRNNAPASEEEAPEAPSEVRYTLKKGGQTELGQGVVQLTDGQGEFTASLDEPGTLLVEFTLPGEGGEGRQRRRRRALGGAVVSPEGILPSAARPEDFDEFWEEKIEALGEIAPNPVLEPVEVDKPGVDYAKITMDHWAGSKIQGQVARPKEGEKFPALLIVQWAGVYPLDKSWAVDRAANGWLVLNILAHDLPIDEPREYYNEQNRGALRDYWAIGNESRETSYFLRMYLSCYRAAEYLTTRDDWDGQTLVVMGGSQGGQQSLVTAAIHPEITAALASVPAGSDMLGPDVGRTPGWPQWYYKTDDRDADRVHEASRYFDVVNFASRITCPVLVGIGHIDETCPPAGIYAAMNLVQGPKEVVPMPIGAHQNVRGSHGPYEDRCWNVWLPALREGKPAPIATGMVTVY